MMKQLSYKLEISFWHIAIYLLTDVPMVRKILKWVYGRIQKLSCDKASNLIRLFLGGLSIGLSIIIIVITTLITSNFLHENSSKASLISSNTNNGQKNILVIGVDEFSDTNPYLFGIWMLIYFPENPSSLTFVPIIPGPKEQSNQTDLNLMESFKLTPNGFPTDYFFDRLHENQIWWHGYVLLDSIAIQEIINFFSQTDQPQLTDLNNILFDPQTLGTAQSQDMDNQNDLLGILCELATSSPAYTDINHLSNLIPNHIRTNLNVHQTIQDWQRLFALQADIRCEFPLKRASNP
jgi:hypothetical protein